MKRRGSAIAYLLSALGLLSALVGGVAAQGGHQVARSGYDLSWWTVDGGGHTSSSGPIYSLGGTIGQPDAGVMSGQGYVLDGGFWPGGAVTYRVHLPLVVRNY
jgi:hypothetical protein